MPTHRAEVKQFRWQSGRALAATLAQTEDAAQKGQDEVVVVITTVENVCECLSMWMIGGAPRTRKRTWVQERTGGSAIGEVVRRGGWKKNHASTASGGV